MRTTEIDLLLIHQTGLYVFEAKHYTSTIYGKMDELQWTQFFKTVDNVTFPNPVLQNRWHVENLRKLIPNFPIHSFIAFTSNECTLKVTGNLPNTTLCKKDDLCKDFWEVARHLPPIIDPKEINEIFDALKIWSPMQNAKVNYEDNKSVDFYQFVEMISNSHNTQKALEGMGGTTINQNVTFNNLQDTTAFAMLQQLKQYNRQMAINGVL